MDTFTAFVWMVITIGGTAAVLISIVIIESVYDAWRMRRLEERLKAIERFTPKN